MNLIIVLRLNVPFGIPDLPLVFISQLLTDTMSLACNLLNSVVLFTHITPHRIEGTVFALLSGAQSFSIGVGGPLLGSMLCS